MKRHKVCLSCGEGIEYEISQGKDRKYCDHPGCVSNRRKLQAAKRKDGRGQCKTKGCSKAVSRVSYELCEACYMRLRRKGNTSTIVYPRVVTASNGYVMVRNQTHRLSNANGYIYQHRFVYHKERGEGPFNCHWCGKQIEWESMHVDHIDDDIKNNDIINLVASCPTCNQSRGAGKMRATMREKYGIMYEYQGVKKTLAEWAATVGVTRSAMEFRIMKGWTLERAFSTAKGATGPKKKI